MRYARRGLSQGRKNRGPASICLHDHFFAKMNLSPLGTVYTGESAFDAMKPGDDQMDVFEALLEAHRSAAERFDSSWQSQAGEAFFA